jgi:chromosome segregation ATPase
MSMSDQDIQAQRHISDCHEKINDLQQALTAAEARITALQAAHAAMGERIRAVTKQWPMCDGLKQAIAATLVEGAGEDGKENL